MRPSAAHYRQIRVAEPRGPRLGLRPSGAALPQQALWRPTMSVDFSTLIWILLALMALQPLLMGRWFAFNRLKAIQALERARGSRVITMIHRQEKRSLFGFSVARHIDLEDAQTIIAAINETPPDRPSDLILHTSG